MVVTGKTQGTIKSDSPDGHIAIQRFVCSTITRQERQAGHINPGHRKWNPVSVEFKPGKELGNFTRALQGKEPLDMVVSVSGGTTRNPNAPGYKVHLTGAVLTGLSNRTVNGMPVEVASFTFSHIEWTWTKGGETFKYDWEARV